LRAAARFLLKYDAGGAYCRWMLQGLNANFRPRARNCCRAAGAHLSCFDHDCTNTYDFSICVAPFRGGYIARRQKRAVGAPLKPNLVGSAGLRTTSGSCRYARHLPGLGNGRIIGHARDRCLYRRRRRSNCACSSMFTLGAKSKELMLCANSTPSLPCAATDSGLNCGNYSIALPSIRAPYSS
jgi:hypothetical protein